MELLVKLSFWLVKLMQDWLIGFIFDIFELAEFSEVFLRISWTLGI